MGTSLGIPDIPYEARMARTLVSTHWIWVGRLTIDGAQWEQIQRPSAKCRSVGLTNLPQEEQYSII
ncbi:hypothetical protein [uncultured Bacteroides sp.]|uniref:hypothetical protein n=1 Tax=uncultured Bacteroides sp. TaxID=162156 RepID=UPI00260DA7FC|nr:hypothetical protein [uncultured Bacteroides sp.]